MHSCTTHQYHLPCYYLGCAMAGRLVKSRQRRVQLIHTRVRRAAWTTPRATTSHYVHTPHYEAGAEFSAAKFAQVT